MLSLGPADVLSLGAADVLVSRRAAPRAGSLADRGG